MAEVSVVIPAHNAASYLKTALDSVLVQTYRDIELIVVDDGSTDATPEILSAYAHRVRVISQANSGVSLARNRGIAESRGRWVAFLDADDAWLPEKIDLQMRALANHPEARAGASAFMVTDESLRPKGTRGGATTGSMLAALLLKGNVVGTPSSVVCERTLLDAIGGFDPDLSLGADWDLWLRLAARTEILVLSAPLVLYRQHGANMSRSVRLLERDSSRLLEKAFADPLLNDALRARRREALGHNDMVLAGSYFRTRAFVDFARCAARAVVRSPREIAYLLQFPGRAGRRARHA